MKIKGVDLKSELIIDFAIVPFIIIIGFISIYFYHHLSGTEYRNIPFYVILGGMIGGMTIGLLFVKYLGKKLSSYWNIELLNNDISIEFKKRNWRFNLNEVSKLKIYGNKKFKYVSFWIDNREPIRMRIGDSGLTPFSDKEDIEKFINRLQAFCNNNYIKVDKVKKNIPFWNCKINFLKKIIYEFIPYR